MSGTRRRFFQDMAVFGAGVFGLRKSLRAETKISDPQTSHTAPTGASRASHAKAVTLSPGPFVPILTPDVPDLPHEKDAGVKVFRLTAEPLKRRIVPFKTLDVCGYSVYCPGPTIQVRQGDRVRIIFENTHHESTTPHWHALDVPIKQDAEP